MFGAIPKLQTASREVNQLQDNILGRLNPERRAMQAMLVPTGGVMPYAAVTPPAGYLLANGQAVSRVTYAALFALCGTTFGAGDGSTTFNVPNVTTALPTGAAWVVKT